MQRLSSFSKLDLLELYLLVSVSELVLVDLWDLQVSSPFPARLRFASAWSLCARAKDASTSIERQDQRCSPSRLKLQLQNHQVWVTQKIRKKLLIHSCRDIECYRHLQIPSDTIFWIDWAWLGSGLFILVVLFLWFPGHCHGDGWNDGGCTVLGGDCEAVELPRKSACHETLARYLLSYVWVCALYRCAREYRKLAVTHQIHPNIARKCLIGCFQLCFVHGRASVSRRYFWQVAFPTTLIKHWSRSRATLPPAVKSSSSKMEKMVSMKPWTVTIVLRLALVKSSLKWRNIRHSFPLRKIIRNSQVLGW